MSPTQLSQVEGLKLGVGICLMESTCFNERLKGELDLHTLVSVSYWWISINHSSCLFNMISSSDFDEMTLAISSQGHS